MRQWTETSVRSNPLSFGVNVRDDVDFPSLARLLEELGFLELWVNDSRRQSGLLALAQAAAATSVLRLGLGVAALTRWTPDSLKREIERLGLATARLVVGVGSGDSRSLPLVAKSVSVLRREFPGVELAVAATGPRMCALAGAIADVVLLSWLSPNEIRERAEWIVASAHAADRLPPRLAAYVRVAVGAGAHDVLRNEFKLYVAHDRRYASADSDERACAGGIALQRLADLRGALMQYEAVLDTCIIRPISARGLVEPAELAVAATD